MAKYDAAGTLLWTRQLGTASEDYSHGVLADRLGNVYISGETGGSLGGPKPGSADAFVTKCAPRMGLDCWPPWPGHTMDDDKRATRGFRGVFLGVRK